jgi:uncharacterized damage-inducible protein DinB
MAVQDSLSQVYLQQWLRIRERTYDFLAVLHPADLALKLDFPEAQSLLDQLWCVVGAHESYLQELRHDGTWQGFSCSLETLGDCTPAAIQRQMQQADQAMIDLLGEIDIAARLPDGRYGYEIVQTMIEHESHHQGQFIPLIYYHHLPIPESWHRKWNLTRDENTDVGGGEE